MIEEAAVEIDILLTVWGLVWPILVAILLFIVMIIIHEFGHFIVAKLVGVRVNEFAVGFGPTLLKWQGKETKYAIRLIPFGGFCAMEGEDSESNDERAFCNKKAWRRFLIIIAGAVFNIVFGLILVFTMLVPNEKFASTTVANFDENATSSKTGLMVGDEILKVNGRRVYTTTDLSYTFSNVIDGKMDLQVRRNGEKVLLENVEFRTEQAEDMNFISVDFWVQGVENTPLNLIVQSIKVTVSYAKMIWMSLIDLITGKYGLNQVSGPVGVTVAIGNAAKAGLSNLLPMIVLITVNLGVFNLLPIPALDGGRAVFILLEMIRRKPVPQKYESLIHTIGFAIIFIFIIFITLKDVLSLF